MKLETLVFWLLTYTDIPAGSVRVPLRTTSSEVTTNSHAKLLAKKSRL